MPRKQRKVQRMNKITGLALAAAAALTVVPAALAGSDAGSVYVAPMVQGVWLDDGRNADDGAGFAFAVGRAISEKWNIELGLHGSSHDATAGRKLKFQAVDVAVQRLFYRDAPVNPYITVGVGQLQTRFPGLRDNEIMLKYGVGVLADIAKNTDKGTNLQLRGEILGRRVDFGNDTAVDYLVGVGLAYSWGGKVARKAPLDSDGDGVPDDMDKCPGTPPGTPVDANGCELDSDGDGVVDSKDKCPGTPRGTKVDEVGCPVDGDADGDGVKDSKDQCPGTPAGAKVNDVGCEIGEIILRGVVFDTGSDVLKPQSLLILDSVATGLAKQPGTKVEIRGHTDDVGSEALNMDLSRRRAEAVKAYLVGKGLRAEDLTTVGLGEMQHIASNDTAENREQNRRVTLQFLETSRLPPGEELVLRGVTFRTGSAQLTPADRLIVDSVVAYVQSRPSYSIQVRGHTDDRGSDEANQRLSEARAKAVADYLVSKGVDAARLSSIGLGETEHVAPNDTEAGRAQNRRVTLKFTGR
jgi:OOP family OmpA-OmpF porin